jgi:hypothetical protein
MAAAASTGRQRYRWLLVLVAAVMLVVWLVGGGGQGDPEPAGYPSYACPTCRPRRSAPWS